MTYSIDFGSFKEDPVHGYDDEVRMFMCFVDDGTISFVPDDAFDDNLKGEFFDKLRSQPNWSICKLHGYGTGIWITVNPYCQEHIDKYISAFANDLGGKIGI